MNLLEVILSYANFCRNHANPVEREKQLIRLLTPLEVCHYGSFLATIQNCVSEDGTLIHGSDVGRIPMDFEVKNGIAD